MRQIGANPAAALQIGGRNYAPSAANFLAVSMQKIDAFSAKSKIGGLGEKGRILGGQDKGNRHSVDAVSGQALVCTQFWGDAGGTVVFEVTCRPFAQSLGFAGF